MVGQWITTIGLSMDIAGIILLWRSAVPRKIPKPPKRPQIGWSGNIGWVENWVKSVGIVMIILGFGFQILATWLPKDL